MESHGVGLTLKRFHFFLATLAALFRREPFDQKPHGVPGSIFVKNHIRPRIYHLFGLLTLILPGHVLPRRDLVEVDWVTRLPVRT
jgi:hypothetical protein